MRNEWLLQDGGSSLLLLCAGWGMDGTPFFPVSSRDYDVLVCFDYGSKAGKPDIASLKRRYKKMVLLCWSMGVVYGQVTFKADASMFSKRIAVNGTLNPIDDTQGIPEKIFTSTLEHMNAENLLRFYRRMCRPGPFLKKFLANRPLRTLSDQCRELLAIQQMNAVETLASSIYTHIVISAQDLVIPTINQINFWQDSPVTMLEGSHFPFYGFSSWDDFIAQFY